MSACVYSSERETGRQPLQELSGCCLLSPVRDFAVAAAVAAAAVAAAAAAALQQLSCKCSTRPRGLEP